MRIASSLAVRSFALVVLAFVAGGSLCLIAGCGDQQAPFTRTYQEQAPSSASTFAAPAVVGTADEAFLSLAKLGAAEAGGQPVAGPPTASGLSPRIVYNAEIRLIVEDDKFAAAEDSLIALAATHLGFVAESEVTGSSGQPQTGWWKFRIPSAQFDPFVQAAGKLGELERQHTDSDDVSDEFYDLEARIKNKLVQEQELLKLLQEATARLESDAKSKMADVLEVADKLQETRGEIERMQGRLNVLKDLTALSTTTVHIFARKAYVPPTAPSFATQISRTFDGSLEALLTIGKAIVLAAVAIGPWIPVAAVVVGPAWYLMKRLVRRLNAPARPIAAIVASTP